MSTPKKTYGPWIEKVLSLTGQTWSLEQITADLGSRVYYRIREPKNTHILCVYPTGISKDDPFFEVHNFLNLNGFCVPSIIDSSHDDGLIIQEDLGVDTLKSTGPENHLAPVVEDLIRLSFLKDRASSVPKCISNRALDHALFMRELKHTTQTLFQYLACSNAEIDRFLKVTSDLLEAVDRFPRVICHRDFHVNNIFFKSSKYFLIDFQDMRMGCGAYDLISLLCERESLKNSDIAFLKERTPLVKHYWKQSKYSSQPFEQFYSQFLLLGIQRALKAVGNFVKGGAYYAHFIPTTLKFVCTLSDELEKISSPQKSGLLFLRQLNLPERWASNRQ